MTAPDELSASLVLVRRAQEGDQEAIERLFARYYDRVRAFVRRRLGAALRLEVESVDIMQETFLVALKQFDRFEVQSSAGFVHWLSRIAEHRIRDLANHGKRDKRDRGRQKALADLREAVTEGSVQFEPAAEITLPPDVADSREIAEKLAAALDGLSEEHREVILHRFYGEATWADVAELMGKGSESAARQLYARALLALGKAFLRA